MRSQPVPLELIAVKPSSFSEPPVSRTFGFHIRGAPKFGPDSQQVVESTTSSLVYPISFQQLGRHGGTVTYFVESLSTRIEWAGKLKDAIARRQQYQEANRVVRLVVLSDKTFGATTFGSLAPEAPVSTQFGRPTCSVTLTTTDGHASVALIVVGCAQGLFIGYRGKPQSMVQVVHLTAITQCAVLQEFGFVLVVANKVVIACELRANNYKHTCLTLISQILLKRWFPRVAELRLAFRRPKHRRGLADKRKYSS